MIINKINKTTRRANPPPYPHSPDMLKTSLSKFHISYSPSPDYAIDKYTNLGFFISTCPFLQAKKRPTRAVSLDMFYSICFIYSTFESFCSLNSMVISSRLWRIFPFPDRFSNNSFTSMPDEALRVSCIVAIKSVA